MNPLFDLLREAMPGIPDGDLPRFAHSLSTPGPYAPCPESQTPADAPRGALRELRHVGESAGIYPGVARTVRVYLPADVSRPCALLVCQDGARYLGPEALASAVLDTLIAAGEIPPTVGVFVEPGETGPGLPIFGGSGNRSVEYDSPGPGYARFLVEELLPFATEGIEGLVLRDTPGSRVICGLSSGGHCALNAALERPQDFGKVISHCGSFVDIRGGHSLAYALRRATALPARVFLQTGEHDLDITYGHWLQANRTMAASLAYREVEHRLVVGEGGHSLAHGGALLADALRWMLGDQFD